MLTAGDEYPIHQTPEPVAFSGSDRNFYDRFFFNGYSADGSVFFAAAMGVYPHLNVIDGYSRGEPFTTDPFGNSVTFRRPQLPPGWPPVSLDGSDVSSIS